MAAKSHLDAICEIFGAVRGQILVDVGCGESALPRGQASLGAACIGIDPDMPARGWQTERTDRWRITRAPRKSGCSPTRRSTASS